MEDLTVDDIELIDKEFISDQFDTYESDLVYKIRYQKEKNEKIEAEEERGEVYLFFLQEMQSRMDFTIPFRLLTYMTFIWLDYFKNTDKDERKKKEFRLPAIIPLVLYNYKDNWTAKRQFKEMIKDSEMFGEYIADFHYILVDVKRLSQTKIKDSNTLIDNVLLTEQMTNAEKWMHNIMEISRRVNQLNTEDRNAWLTWFEKAFVNCSEDTKREFLEQFQKGDDKMISSIETILMEEREAGKIEGRIEGRMEEKRETALNMKKRGYSDNTIADILEVGVNKLHQWFTSANLIKS